MGPLSRRVTFLAVALASAPALAAIPAGYMGTPFDPAKAGGVGIVPPSVKAGPYAIPGRISFVNYDMGGDGVGYHTDAHYTTKAGDGYRSDRPSATMSKTRPDAPDIYYDTGMAALDGTVYPNATDLDFYVGSVHPGDWFNYTVDVKTAGTYALSQVFSTGNGPPGGEGGDGQMELDIFVNGTKMTSWHTVFPDYQDKANFHNWKPYPTYATLTLEAGLQVIKFQAPYKHLNLDYVDFALMASVGAAGSGGGAGAAGATGAAGDASGGGAGSVGSSGSSGAAGSSTGAAGDPTGAAGSATGAGGDATGASSGVAGSTGAAGSVGSTGVAGAGGGPKQKGGGGCSVAGSSGTTLGLLLLGLALLAASRRASARRAVASPGTRRSRR
jgi:hypothetical protein